MSRTDVTDRAVAEAGAPQCSAVTARAWLQVPAAAPGVFRVRPLPGEATASYAQRIAMSYQLTLPQLLDGAGIALHGHGTLPAAGLHLNHNAARHLAALARVPLPDLLRALPRPALNDTAPSAEAAARWKRLDAAQQPVRACTPCTHHRSHGTTDTAWVHPPPHRLVCPRHQQAAPDPRLASPSTRGPCPNSRPRTTPTSACYDIPAPLPPGPRHAPSPPAGTTTSNISPTAGTPA